MGIQWGKIATKSNGELTCISPFPKDDSLIEFSNTSIQDLWGFVKKCKTVINADGLTYKKVKQAWIIIFTSSETDEKKFLIQRENAIKKWINIWKEYNEFFKKINVPKDLNEKMKDKKLLEEMMD